MSSIHVKCMIMITDNPHFLFQNGQIVSSALAERDLQTIRSDKITWVRGTESGCINIGFLINQVSFVTPGLKLEWNSYSIVELIFLVKLH